MYFAAVKPGDTVLGLNLAHGGHLTHGHHLNFSGVLYKVVPYGVKKDDERIDYDEIDRLADEHKPKMIIVGASAYPRVIDFPRIRAASKRVGAVMMTDMAHIAGLVATGNHPSPVPHSDLPFNADTPLGRPCLWPPSWAGPPAPAQNLGNRDSQGGREIRSRASERVKHGGSR